MFHIYTTVAFIYLLWRFVLPLPVSRGVKVVAAIALLAISKYHLLSQVFFGNMFSPELPFLVVLALGWLFCAFVLLVTFTVLGDFAYVLYFLIQRAHWSRQSANWWRGTALAAAALLSAVGVAQAISVPRVHRVELGLQNLPAEFEGFRLVQLSDLHISPLFPRSWTQAVVERTNALAPDLLVVTGDLIDGSTEARRNDVAPLAALRARHGVLAIPGNHEYYFDDPAWESEFKALGMHMLTNQHRVISEGDGRLTIAGVSDQVAPSYGHPGPDLTRALTGAPSTAPTILLSHRPVDAATNARAGVALQLSGHTHGGMVRGLDLVAGPANDGYVSRAYSVGDMQLYVSNGTGLWMGFPIRLGVPSEITEFTLRRAAANAIKPS